MIITRPASALKAKSHWQSFQQPPWALYQTIQNRPSGLLILDSINFGDPINLPIIAMEEAGFSYHPYILRVWNTKHLDSKRKEGN